MRVLQAQVSHEETPEMLTLEEESGAHDGKRELGPLGATQPAPGTSASLPLLLPPPALGVHSREQTTLPRVPGTQGRVSSWGGLCTPGTWGGTWGQPGLARSLSCRV